MPLVVPALRFFVVFLNVYETFKTLKPPPPSARRAGKPSTRALTQRKRDLKGCLAVWVVWCCYAAYERTFDRAVGIFLPFYSETKSVFLLFLVLTRAKGAEPLFLHVLRPLVKPYVAVVDPMLELSRDLGDFLFTLLQIPLDYILSSSWFPLWHTGESAEEPAESSASASGNSVDSGDSAHMDNHSDIAILVDHDGAAQPSRAQNKRQGSVRSVSDNQIRNGHPFRNSPLDSRASRSRRSVSASTTSLPAYSEHPSHDPPQYSRTLSRYNGRQIQYSPASAFPIPVQETPISTLDLLGTAPEYHSPEWRTYPAFPSAYPPTPLHTTTSLPNSSTTRSGNDYRLVSDSAHPPIPENEQGFGEMLERQHEGHPGFVHGSGNGNKIPSGVDNSQDCTDATQQPDEDTLLDDSMCSSDAGLSEDDLGTSLRTPHRSPEAIPSSAYSSVDNLTSALTTADNASSLRAKTSSDSLSSGSSSLAGRKRDHGAFQGKAWGAHVGSQSRNATLRGRPAPSSIPQDPLQSSTSEDEHESEGGDEDSSTKAKRRRVLDPLKRRSVVRLAAKGVGSARKAPLPSRGVITARERAVATVSQATVRTRVTTNNSTVKGRKPTIASHQVMRGGPQGIIKTASTSSTQSGTLRGRAH